MNHSTKLNTTSHPRVKNLGTASGSVEPHRYFLKPGFGGSAVKAGRLTGENTENTELGNHAFSPSLTHAAVRTNRASLRSLAWGGQR